MLELQNIITSVWLSLAHNRGAHPLRFPQRHTLVEHDGSAYDSIGTEQLYLAVMASVRKVARTACRYVAELARHFTVVGNGVVMSTGGGAVVIANRPVRSRFD